MHRHHLAGLGALLALAVLYTSACAEAEVPTGPEDGASEALQARAVQVTEDGAWDHGEDHVARHLGAHDHGEDHARHDHAAHDHGEDHAARHQGAHEHGENHAERIHGEDHP